MVINNNPRIKQLSKKRKNKISKKDLIELEKLVYLEE